MITWSAEDLLTQKGEEDDAGGGDGKTVKSLDQCHKKSGSL